MVGLVSIFKDIFLYRPGFLKTILQQPFKVATNKIVVKKLGLVVGLGSHF